MCVACSTDDSSTSALQWVLGVFSCLFFMLVLFLLGWRHVFPNNILHRSLDRAQQHVLERTSIVASKSKGVRKDAAQLKVAIAGLRVNFRRAKFLSSTMVKPITELSDHAQILVR